MKDTKQLKIDAAVDEQLQTAARHFALSKKAFAEEAILFFAKNNISPRGYSPCREFDQVQLIRKSTDRIIGMFQQQGQESFAGLLAEILRSQVSVQALINLVVDYAVEPEMQNTVAQRVQDYIQQHMKQLEANAPLEKRLE